MASSGMLLHVAVVRADVSEERSASIIRMTRATRRNIPDNIILNIFLLKLHEITFLFLSYNDIGMEAGLVVEENQLLCLVLTYVLLF
jgi:hypothetical protein